MLRAAFFAVAMLVYAFTGPGAGPAAAGSFRFPETWPGEVASKFIAAFNSGSDSAMTVFHTAHQSDSALASRSVETLVWEYKRLHVLLGSLDPHRVVQVTDSTIVVLTHSTSLDTWFHVGFEFNREVPRKLRHHFIRPAARPKRSPAKGSRESGSSGR